MHTTTMNTITPATTILIGAAIAAWVPGGNCPFRSELKHKQNIALVAFPSLSNELHTDLELIELFRPRDDNNDDDDEYSYTLSLEPNSELQHPKAVGTSHGRY